ncbi:hypothetical protein [Paenibacillus baekrokdamisoli]|nr:hypothetical protein [Paenibacillus baekrokdamisoli]
METSEERFVTWRERVGWMIGIGDKLILLAGYMQLGVVIGSFAVPFLLNWRSELAAIRKLTRQVFWTYAAYVLGTNLFFAILSISLTSSLTDGSELATAMCSFIALYWAARLGIQFFYFDKKGLPSGGIYQIGEWLLVVCFLFFTIVYSGAAYVNGWGMHG